MGLSVSGKLEAENARRDSLATLATSSLSLSLPTTDRLCLVRAIEPSSSGTPSVNASSLSRRRATQSGLAASPSPQQPVIVSAGWDKLVKVWSLTNCRLRTNLLGHSGYLNTVTVSPDGSLCASGGKDGTAILWDLTEGKRLYSLDAGDIINSLVFSPNRYWLVAATAVSIK